MSDFPVMEYKPVDGEELIELAPHETSLDFLRKVYRSVKQPMSRRMRAAIEALQHEHPRLQATATTNISGRDFASVLERAIQRSLAGKPIKLIEPERSKLMRVGEQSNGRR
jgi:hypothetical protein